MTVSSEDSLIQDQCDWQESSGTGVVASDAEEHRPGREGTRRGRAGDDEWRVLAESAQRLISLPVLRVAEQTVCHI